MSHIIEKRRSFPRAVFSLVPFQLGIRLVDRTAAPPLETEGIEPVLLRHRQSRLLLKRSAAAAFSLNWTQPEWRRTIKESAESGRWPSASSPTCIGSLYFCFAIPSPKCEFADNRVPVEQRENKRSPTTGRLICVTAALADVLLDISWINLKDRIQKRVEFHLSCKACIFFDHVYGHFLHLFSQPVHEVTAISLDWSIRKLIRLSFLWLIRSINV